MDTDTIDSDNGIGVCCMDTCGYCNVNWKHPNKVSPGPTQASFENEDTNETSVKDKTHTWRLQPINDLLQNEDTNRGAQIPTKHVLPDIRSDAIDKESCLTIIPRNLMAFPEHIWKVLRCKEKLFPKRHVEPRDPTPKQVTKIIFLRLLMILHNILIIWRVTIEKNNQLYWLLALTILLQILEMVYSLVRDRRIQKR